MRYRSRRWGLSPHRTRVCVLGSEMLVEEGFVRGAHERTLADVAAAYAASDAASVPARKHVERT